MFHNNAPRDLQTLKSRIAEECDAFTVGELAAAISNLSERCHLLDQVDGGHFEHLMWTLLPFLKPQMYLMLTDNFPVLIFS